LGAVPSADYYSVLLGMQSGPMGSTNILVVLACLLYLCARRTVRIQQPLFMLLAAAAAAVLFPRIDASPLQSVFYELFATPILFASAFVFTDPVTSPKRAGAKLFYGIFCGFTVMFFRHFGGYANTLFFAVLTANMTSWAFDEAAERYQLRKRRKGNALRAKE